MCQGPKLNYEWDIKSPGSACLLQLYIHDGDYEKVPWYIPFFIGICPGGGLCKKIGRHHLSNKYMGTQFSWIGPGSA